MDFVMALEANCQEKLNLIQPIPKPPSPMVNLARHLVLANLAYRIVG
jgi:hypothetical protein